MHLKPLLVIAAIFVLVILMNPTKALAAASCTLKAAQGSLSSGAAPVPYVRIDWTASNATSIVISNGIGAVSPVSSGYRISFSDVTAIYTATVTATDGTTATCTSSTPTPPPPTACEYPATPTGYHYVAGPNYVAQTNCGMILVADSSGSTSCTSAGITHYLYFGSSDVDTGGDVSRLQLYLKSAGYLDASAPLGYYGPMTQEAVQQFQAANGIVSSGTPNTTGYGAVGPTTLAALNAACANGITVAPPPPPAPTTVPAASGVCDTSGQPFSCISGAVYKESINGTSLTWGCFGADAKTVECSAPNPLGNTDSKESLRVFNGTGAITADPTIKFLVNGSLAATGHTSNGSGAINILNGSTPLLGWDISGMPAGAVCTRTSTTVGTYSNWPGVIGLIFGASMGSMNQGLRIAPDSSNSATFKVSCVKSRTNSTVLASATVTVRFVSTTAVTPPSIPQVPLAPISDGGKTPRYGLGIVEFAPTFGGAGTKVRVYGTNISYYRYQPGGLYVNLGKPTTVINQNGTSSTTVAWKSVPSSFGVGLTGKDNQAQLSEYLEFTVPPMVFDQFRQDNLYKIALGPKDMLFTRAAQTARTNADFIVTDINPLSSVTVLSPNGGEKITADGKTNLTVSYNAVIVLPTQPPPLNSSLNQINVQGQIVFPNGLELPGNWLASKQATTSGSGTLSINLTRLAASSTGAYSLPSGQYKVKVCVPDLSQTLYAIGGNKAQVCDLSNNTFTVTATTNTTSFTNPNAVPASSTDSGTSDSGSGTAGTGSNTGSTSGSGSSGTGSTSGSQTGTGTGSGTGSSGSTSGSSTSGATGGSTPTTAGPHIISLSVQGTTNNVAWITVNGSAGVNGSGFSATSRVVLTNDITHEVIYPPTQFTQIGSWQSLKFKPTVVGSFTLFVSDHGLQSNITKLGVRAAVSTGGGSGGSGGGGIVVGGSSSFGSDGGSSPDSGGVDPSTEYPAVDTSSGWEGQSYGSQYDNGSPSPGNAGETNENAITVVVPA